MTEPDIISGFSDFRNVCESCHLKSVNRNGRALSGSFMTEDVDG